MPQCSPSGQRRAVPRTPIPGLTLPLPAATASPAVHLSQCPGHWERLVGCSWEAPQLQGAGIVPSQTLQVRGIGDKHHNHQHITAVTHFGTFGTKHSTHPSVSDHTAKQGTQTPTNITSKPPGRHKAKGVSKVIPSFPAPPCPSFREHLGMTQLPQPDVVTDLIMSVPGRVPDIFNPDKAESLLFCFETRAALRRKTESVIFEVRHEDQEFSKY